MRAGGVPFPFSPRNSPAAISHLLRTSGCKSWFISNEPSTLDLARSTYDELDYEVTELTIPQFDELFEKDQTDWTHKMMCEYGTFPTKGDIDPCGEVLSNFAHEMTHIIGASLIPWMVISGLILSFFSPHEGAAAMLMFYLGSLIRNFCLYVQPAFIPIEGDGDMLRLQHPSHTLAVCNHLIDGVGAMDTNELVIRHPENEALFEIFGCFDDQIARSSGEKMNPIPIETMLIKDPLIDSALVFGSDFNQVSLSFLLPSKFSILRTSSALKSTGTRYAHPKKPFEYTAKGALRRAAILSAYEGEIANAYKPVDETSQTGSTIAIGGSIESVTFFVRGLLHKLVKPGMQDTDNAFELGADSLTAISIQNSILLALKKAQVPNAAIRALPSNLVYKFPNIHALSDLLHVTIVDSAVSNSPAETQDDNDKEIFDRSEPSLATMTVIKLRKGKGETPHIALPGVPSLLDPLT
ncbi:hypothetical protein C8J56DRAFT_1073495 [Mycena floridula]|nr:hypothetical protein C8J56DRAFT_1073495 [Mycena floridula]